MFRNWRHIRSDDFRRFSSQCDLLELLTMSAFLEKVSNEFPKLLKSEFEYIVASRRFQESKSDCAFQELRTIAQRKDCQACYFAYLLVKHTSELPRPVEGSS